jgi:hypothetical protein
MYEGSAGSGRTVVRLSVVENIATCLRSTSKSRKDEKGVARGYYERAVRKALAANAADGGLPNSVPKGRITQIEIILGGAEADQFDADIQPIGNHEYKLRVTERALRSAEYLRSTMFHEVFHMNQQFEMIGYQPPQKASLRWFEEEHAALQVQQSLNKHFGLNTEEVGLLAAGQHGTAAEITRLLNQR